MQKGTVSCDKNVRRTKNEVYETTSAVVSGFCDIFVDIFVHVDLKVFWQNVFLSLLFF